MKVFEELQNWLCTDMERFCAQHFGVHFLNLLIWHQKIFHLSSQYYILCSDYLGSICNCSITDE